MSTRTKDITFTAEDGPTCVIRFEQDFTVDGQTVTKVDEITVSVNIPVFAFTDGTNFSDGTGWDE